jgi:hypothetical protein
MKILLAAVCLLQVGMSGQTVEYRQNGCDLLVVEEGYRCQTNAVWEVHGQIVPVGLLYIDAAPVLSAPLPDRITQDSGQVYRLDGADSDRAFTVNDLSPASRQPRFTPCELPSGEIIQSSANQAFAVMPACVYDSEPVDVPAIQVPTNRAPDCGSYFNDQPMWRQGEYCTTERPLIWTCADKSRILETAEDGTKWCRKVER